MHAALSLVSICCRTSTAHTPTHERSQRANGHAHHQTHPPCQTNLWIEFCCNCIPEEQRERPEARDDAGG